MDNLPFQNEELDLIWSEGAIYNIGFERGMNEWNKYLKKRRFHRSERSILVHFGTPCGNRRLLDGRLSRKSA